MEIIYLIIGIILGGIIGFLIKSKKGISETEANELKSQILQLTEENSRLKTDNSYLEENVNASKKELLQEKEKSESLNKQLLELTDEKGKAVSRTSLLEKQLNELQTSFEEISKKYNDANSQISQLKTENKNLLEKLENQKKEIEEMQKKFSDAFENLANKIFEEKSEKFTEKNKMNIDEILKPLKEKINEFENKIENTHKENLMSHTSLIEQIKNLEKLNKQISDDASNLTKALKSDVKVQGNWGEVILERILEESGLQKGIEYIPQGEGMKLSDEEGRRFQPDIIIKLPENKHIIVDSKVSLIHYEQYVSADDEKKREEFLKKLNTSIKTHIDGLYKKHYHDLKGLNSPDFVLLFMPIEGSFAVALQHDNSLYKYALEKHIVIVSPSTLLATLRTIAFIWRQENQTKNALEIARQSGNLYDAFVRLLEDLEKVGNNLEKASKSHQDVIKKLSTGRGNLISRVENIKKLGAKANKKIPEKFIEEETPELTE
ncbi:MAG: DNA recombination protein RmuC [Candidatus Cloacimonadota bacterium]|nr:MAG: DNA recombination protein RmuC [Candidatus Cloacimonadota bacterium]